MPFVHAIVYGLISGFTQFLPISASAHQNLYSFITGYQPHTPFLSLMVLLGCFAALIFCTYSRLTHLYREMRIYSLSKKRRNRVPDMQAVLDVHLLLFSLVPMVLGYLLRHKILPFVTGLTWLSFMLIISGILLYAPQFFRQGNRDSRDMGPFDGIFLGIWCAFSVVPGISAVAIILYFFRAKFCSRTYSLDMALLLQLPLILIPMIGQLFTLLQGSGLTGTDWLLGGICGIAAFLTGYGAITLMRYFAVKLDFHGIAFYCWGASVFCFLYYLIT